jgi:hypothetical protein
MTELNAAKIPDSDKLYHAFINELFHGAHSLSSMGCWLLSQWIRYKLIKSVLSLLRLRSHAFIVPSFKIEWHQKNSAGEFLQ